MKIKHILIFVLNLIAISELNAQASPLFIEEITLFTEGFTQPLVIHYYLEAVGPVWANSTITTNYSFAQEVISGNRSSTGKGWLIFFENADVEPIAHGLYKLFTSDKDNFIFLDLRDCKWANQDYSGQWYSPTDFSLKYDYANDKFYYRNIGSFYPIADGGIIGIWTIKNGTRVTDCFELYLKISNQNGHPYLSWNEYHDESSVLHYNVYKKESGGTYSVLATTNNNYYIDNTATFYSYPNQKTYLYYKISAQLNVSQESLFGNEERVAVNEIQNIEKILEENENISDESYNFKLLPNYPNPFNPSTSITYQLPKKGHVTLKVYNTLGKEVAELVNKAKEEGVYSVTFNGDNLPSGMYFYKIQTGEFVDVKKMLLLK